jgi:hypothetical protein
MTEQELRRLARLGAEARLEALQRDIAAIYQVFPELRSGRSNVAPNPYSTGVKSAVRGAVTRRPPRRMSRAARKRIAEAQRKRWAEWRAKQGRTVRHEGAAAGILAAGRSRKKK